MGGDSRFGYSSGDSRFGYPSSSLAVCCFKDEISPCDPHVAFDYPVVYRISEYCIIISLNLVTVTYGSQKIASHIGVGLSVLLFTLTFVICFNGSPWLSLKA